MRAFGRQWLSLGCAAALGAMIAFPAGMFLSGRHPVRSDEAGSRAAGAPFGREPEARNHYSPTVLTDPYVRRKHEEIVEMLETSCRQTRQGCAEARTARRYLEGEAGRER